ncbi:hypothetical protein NKR19_g1018 [Coniochaeta hoffmannii]|uniref:Uncharacterized protein n=1 Tax=Coniochaeta hoffmannii TaxID=91930 RepID=A0AA38S1P1_9PEZI|nr:hypothetical protein NKR19_g1018 [Coniochaeta hoffmannii]
MPEPVDLLILGAGWTFQFLEPLLREQKIRFAATTTTGRDNTIPFRFDPDSEDQAPYRALPSATTILITFPLKGTGQSSHLVDLYTTTHPPCTPQWIQLGSTGIFTAPAWNDERSEYDKTSPRAIAEDELISHCRGCVLDLAGLYGGVRDPRNYLGRVAKTKEQLRAKGAVHLVHGADVARAVLAAHRSYGSVCGQRWIVADLRTYDWWELAIRWGGEEYARWVGELMEEDGVRALPRPVETLGRVLDSRGFWNAVGVWPVMSIPGGRLSSTDAAFQHRDAN